MDNKQLLINLLDYKIPNDLINLIYDFSLDFNDICKNIFMKFKIDYYQGIESKRYIPKYHHNSSLNENIDLSNIIINAKSKYEATIIWMNYLNNNLISRYEKSNTYFFSEFLFLMDLCNEILMIEFNDCKTIYEMCKYFLNNGLPKIMFDKYCDNLFDNDTLWLEEEKIQSSTLSAIR